MKNTPIAKTGQLAWLDEHFENIFMGAGGLSRWLFKLADEIVGGK